jgi:hypothetical protein
MKEDVTNKWITKGIRLSCERKRILYNILTKSGDDTLKSYYKKYSTIVAKVILRVTSGKGDMEDH